MWNRLQTAASSTTTLIQSPADFLHVPHQHKRFSRSRSTTDLNHFSQSQPNNLDADKQFWQDSFESRLRGTDVASEAPYKYEICRGKTVPISNDSSSHTPLGSRDQLLLTTDLGESESESESPKPSAELSLPYNPSQLLLHDQKGPVSITLTTYGDNHRRNHDNDYDSLREYCLTAGREQTPSASPLASPPTGSSSSTDNMYRQGPRMVDAHGVSPPSSPEMNPEDYGAFYYYDVSPLEEEPVISYPPVANAPPPDSDASVQPRESQAPPHQPKTRRSSGQQPKSSIPTMRRERRRQQDAANASAARAPRLNQPDKRRETAPAPSPNAQHNSMPWADPAGSGSGRSTPGLPLDDGQPYGFTTTITSQTAQPRGRDTPSPSFGQRVRQFGRNKAEPLETRPAWNGASGRQAMVQPVRDDKNAAPLSAPPKSNKRADRNKNSPPEVDDLPPPGVQAKSETSRRSPAAAAVRRFMPSWSHHTGETQDQSSPIMEPATHNATAPPQFYPSPPSTNSPPTDAPAPQSYPTITSPSPPFAPPNPDKTIKRKPPPPTVQTNPASPIIHPPSANPIASGQADALGLTSSPVAVDSTLLKPGQPDDGWVQPSSAFSITTYSTSAAASPRVSADDEHPPLPEAPKVSSVMDRRRPRREANSPDPSAEEPVVISLKSASISFPSKGGTPNGKPAPTRNFTDIKSHKDRSMSVSSLGKALPPAPPEMVESTDRIENMQTKLNSLSHRRNNINKSIKQMTELMPADRLLQSDAVLKKREEEKQKVERLKEELSEIQQEEYDLGLKLYRAYKRQDRESEFESGKLWVRRIDA